MEAPTDQVSTDQTYVTKYSQGVEVPNDQSYVIKYSKGVEAPTDQVSSDQTYVTKYSQGVEGVLMISLTLQSIARVWRFLIISHIRYKV